MTTNGEKLSWFLMVLLGLAAISGSIVAAILNPTAFNSVNWPIPLD